MKCTNVAFSVVTRKGDGVAQNNRAKLHHTLQYSSDNKAAMNTGGL